MQLLQKEHENYMCRVDLVRLTGRDRIQVIDVMQTVVHDWHPSEQTWDEIQHKIKLRYFYKYRYYPAVTTELFDSVIYTSRYYTERERPLIEKIVLEYIQEDRQSPLESSEGSIDYVI